MLAAAPRSNQLIHFYSLLYNLTMQQTVAESTQVAAETLTMTVACHWAPRRIEDLAASDLVMVKQRLLDTLGAGMAGVATAEAQAARQGMSAIYGTAGVSAGAAVWGTDQLLPPPQAALVNGTASHALELDDFDGCGHTGAVIIPTVTAVAQACGAGGATVLTAIAAGYDLAGRMLNAAGGYRAHNGLGWHSTATCGTFGAALAAAKVLGLNEAQTAHALGIAGSYLGGVWAFMKDGAMTKRLHPGKAAETGISAAYLAQAGMTGPAHILEAEWGGFFSTYCGPHADASRLLDRLGAFNAIGLTGVKPYACCRGSHAAIDALLALMQKHRLASADIASIDVDCPPHIAKLVGGKRIANVLDAQMSMAYTLAVTALTGRAGLAEFTPPRMDQPEVQRLINATQLHPVLPATHLHGPVVKVRCTDGRLLQEQVLFAKGHPENPVSDEEIRTKARDLMAPILGSEQSASIERAIDHIEEIQDFRTFAALLQKVR